jgi:putative hydrolase of the HAD superfamily
MPKLSKIKAIVFDWGDTIMQDYELPGPMSAWSKVAWIDGAEAALKALHPKFNCIIATSADHSDTREMKSALARVGADRYFHQFYSQKELGFKKPDVRFFEAVLQHSGFEPGSTAMVGNLYDKDIVGAKKAGMKTVFLNQNRLQGQFIHADFVIHSMKDLVSLFNT